MVAAALALLRLAINASCAESRERSLAFTRLDEAEMWLERTPAAAVETPDNVRQMSSAPGTTRS